MMKLLLVLFVVLVGGWLLLGRKRGGDDQPPPQAPPPGKLPTMIACARCGLHLPAAEVVRDAEGRPYCDEPHRALGPRPAADG